MVWFVDVDRVGSGEVRVLKGAHEAGGRTLRGALLGNLE